MLRLYHLIARLLRLIPKTTNITMGAMAARFFVPVTNHYICDDLHDMKCQKREPELYEWLHHLPKDSVLFDIGTSYGQESSLASSMTDKNITVVGFDCGLYQSHFCCLNKALNQDRFRFVFAALGETSGEQVTITSNSDTHLPQLHKKNVPYHYEVMSLALDDFATKDNLFPTHIKMDIDGAELSALKGADKILQNPKLTDIFIEVDHANLAIIDLLAGYGFHIVKRLSKDLNDDILFQRQL